MPLLPEHFYKGDAVSIKIIELNVIPIFPESISVVKAIVNAHRPP